MHAAVSRGANPRRRRSVMFPSPRCFLSSASFQCHLLPRSNCCRTWRNLCPCRPPLFSSTLLLGLSVYEGKEKDDRLSLLLKTFFFSPSTLTNGETPHVTKAVTKDNLLLVVLRAWRRCRGIFLGRVSDWRRFISESLHFFLLFLALLLSCFLPSASCLIRRSCIHGARRAGGRGGSKDREIPGIV